ASFAAEVVESARPRAVLTLGAGRFALALADAAEQQGLLCVRLDAGDRAGAGRDRSRRLADHAAQRWCVRAERARRALVDEGCDEDLVAVVGSLTRDALAGWPPPEQAARRHVWLACEHGQDPALEAHVGAVCEQLELDLQIARPADPPQRQLQLARSADVIVTDSLGYQEFADAAGRPCVVLAPAGARPDLLTSGRVRVAEHRDELHGVLAQRRDAPREEPPVPAAADAVIDALARWTAPAAKGELAAAAPTPLPSEGNASGRSFDGAEARALRAVLDAGALNSTRGTYVHRFEREFAEWLGVKHAIACANGSAAVHCALAALKLSAGDEVITTPITDMGALTPIWYEGAVPVFADVDPDTLNVTADTIGAQLTERTRAIVVTHLFGRTCDMDPILALAEERGLPVLEDAAQAYGASLDGRLAGTLGSLAAFSLQQGKHITTGEGGVVCTDDDGLARQVFLYVNKAFGYGDAKPDHYFPALNYRMTELQGAVACAQLPKLDAAIAVRRMVAEQLREGLEDLAGVRCPGDPDGGEHAYWKWSFLVDDQVVCGGAVELGARMRALGVACAPRYVQKPAFECQVFERWREHPVSSLPLRANPRGDREGPLFVRADYPGAVRGLQQVVVLPINERYRRHHVEFVIDQIRRAHRELTRA
ncbi:MAG: DegT/DnrJ/EryC1/StrS family aminotransferase, partial [Planctomycetota bacterium]